MNLLKKLNCDIFCTVVDNYGDIGVCWRLAKQLANEHGVGVRLWVDDLMSFRKLCHEIDVNLSVQQQHGVEIRRWATPFPEIIPSQLVIEAFACELPENFVIAMAQQETQPVWLNLEYLSAEAWVAGCHGLVSPHPRLPLVKYFYFPGFTQNTGGVLLEQDLLTRRDKFLADADELESYWYSLGVPLRQDDEVRVSLFGYENDALQALLTAWSQGQQCVTCLVPEGRILPQVAAFFGRTEVIAGDVLQLGKLRIHVLAFVEQDEYDKLLWACDINFVRGEDSCVRAQWAGKPFIWQIYPQHDGVHLQKLGALLDLYCVGLLPDTTKAMHAMWGWWNEEKGQENFELSSFMGEVTPWNDFLAQQPVLRQHTDAWAKQLSANNLALNLLDFSRKVGRIAPFEI
jgi:uncharacterized repeat protein (TIGR03837 family)